MLTFAAAGSDSAPASNQYRIEQVRVVFWNTWVLRGCSPRRGADAEANDTFSVMLPRCFGCVSSGSGAIAPRPRWVPVGFPTRLHQYHCVQCMSVCPPGARRRFHRSCRPRLRYARATVMAAWGQGLTLPRKHRSALSLTTCTAPLPRYLPSGVCVAMSVVVEEQAWVGC